MKLRFGLVLESLNLPLRKAVDQAVALGVLGVQFDAAGELAPDRLSATGRKDLKHLFRSRGLDACAVGCPLRYGLNVTENLEGRLGHVKKVLSLAYDLGPRLVVVYPGALPAEPTDPLRLLMIQSLTELGRHADRVGVALALELGVEPPELWTTCLESIGTGGLGTCLDPATLVAAGHDPVAAVRSVASALRYVYARDGLPGRPDRGANEVALGHGDVDWNALLGSLEEVGYRGWLAIKRGLTRDPAAALAADVTFLQRLVG